MGFMYVGQKVKVVREVDGYKHIPIGTETVISGKYDGYMSEIGTIMGYLIHWPHWTDNGYFTENIICRPEELEPILPEGMKGVEWSDCLWQPESEAVLA